MRIALEKRIKRTFNCEPPFGATAIAERLSQKRCKASSCYDDPDGMSGPWNGLQRPMPELSPANASPILGV